MVSSLIDLSTTSNPELYEEYIVLLMNDLIRFVGDDFTPLTPEFKLIPKPDEYVTSQGIEGVLKANTSLVAEEKVLVDFSSRYADEEFSTFDEFVEASACDFMNLHNGLFTVNVSNDHEIELTLTPPVTVKGSTCEGFTEAIALPIQYTFGTVTFVITK